MVLKIWDWAVLVVEHHARKPKPGGCAAAIHYVSTGR